MQGLCLLELLEPEQDPRFLSSALDSPAIFLKCLSVAAVLLMAFSYLELQKTSEGTVVVLGSRSMEAGFEAIFWGTFPVPWF